MAASRTVALVLAVTLHAGLGCGPEEPAPPTGQVLFQQRCAACHGDSGRGDGPVAPTLTTRPTDLTRLAASNDGRFDEGRIIRIIDGRKLVAAHGPREMPVWGAVFSEDLAGEPHRGYTVLLHARALTDYLRSIQIESD